MEKLKFVVLGHVPASYQVQDANTTMNISQTLSAYEVTTAKVLKDESNQLQKNDQLCPKVFCASSNDWLVVSVESDIHIFDMSMGCTEFHPDKSRNRNWEEKHTSLEPGDGKTVALSFLPSCEIFMVVQNNGTIKFSSPTNRLIYKKDLVISQIADCSMQISKSTDDLAYMACLLDRQHSIVHFIKIPQYDFSIRDEEALSAHFSSVECTRTVQLDYTGAHFVVTMMGSYIFFPKDKGQLVSKISTYPEGFGEISPLFTLDENLAMVRSVGSTIVVLLPSGKLMLFDECFVQLCTLCPFYNDDEFENVLDFEFLDGDALELNQNLKILFKVKTATGIKFKIKHFNQTTEEFSTDCSRHAILIPITAPDDDNSIVYVDPFPNQMTDSILIRIVSEAQPVIRLNKLLELKRFEAAQNFAKSNNLSMDLIFAAIVRHCQEQIQATEGGDYDEALFLEMKHNLTQLTNHNMAADLCLASLTLLTCFDHIKTLLEFTNRLKITDEYTRNEIARFSYEFASYRMVYGFEDAGYGPGSMWREFESSETHKEFFDHFCEQGKIAEARILFSRYIEIPRNITKPEIIRKLLSTFQQAITANPRLCPEIGEFFESDLIPIFFYTGDSPKNICVEICDFFIAISLQLEQIQAKLFPKNALNFAQTFNRAIQFLKLECRTTDQYVAFLLILKQLDEEDEPNSENSTSSIVKLKTLIRNLTKLIKIHDTYQCPMSYAEFLSENVHSICHRILDRLRAVQSVKQHIEQFVFPYIEEHRLDRNQMLHAYIKELASANRYTKSIQHGNNTWDILCLQIAEQITDMNMRCRAIIEIANGTMPPWNQQLTNVIKGIFTTQTDKIDPELVSKLREQYLYADLGQIFIQYQIPLDVRSRIVGNSAIKSLLRFIFKNSDKEMAIKIQDALKIVEIYGCLFQTSKLEQQPLTSTDCHYLYATVLLQHFSDEWEIKPLIDLFQLIKAPEDVQEVATKLIIHIKTLLEPSEIKKIISRRPIWLACFLCVLERFKQESPQCSDLIQKARNIRTLQQNYKIILGFETFQNKDKCEDILRDFIESSSLEKKSITVIDVKCFGNLLCFSIVDTCNILLNVQIQHELPEAVMSTLSYLLSANNSLSMSILEDIQIACDFVLWELTKIVTNEERNDDKMDFLKNIVSSFKPIMPSLLNWSASLESLKHIETYSNISRYITFFSLVLELHANGDESARASNSGASILPNDDAKSVNDRQKTSNGNNKNYTTNPRMAVMTPQQEGTMFDPITVVKAISVVASSIADRPILNEKEREEFYAQMRISWERVFMLLSSSHILLEIQARQLANNLSCFKNGPMDGALVGMDRLVSELCKKIFNIPVADLELATHLLCSLAPDQTLKILLELRRWISPKNNVRNMLNIIRVSLFILLIQNQDMTNVKQTIIWFELAQWQKRLFKQGINIGYTQLKRDGVFELLANFAKIQLPFWLLKEFCQAMKANTPDIMLNYALELCKFSACLANDPERFKNCIETAKAALKEMNVADERVGFILNRTINELCPYNYEAIDLLLGKLQELHKQGILFNEAKTNARIIDSFKLMKFLRLYKRQGSIMPIEIRWYKQFVNPKYYEMSMLTKSGQAETFDETVGLAMGEVTIMQQIGQQQPAGAHYSQRFESLLHESNLPKSAKERLPFHLFMLEDKESVDKFQTFFVYNEMTIYNVQFWISLVESTEVILQHSRTNLLVGSINTYVREVVKYKRKISQDDLNQINMLIYDSHNRLSILKGLASRFQRLPLGITKISLIELCCDVVNKWLQHAEELQIESGKEREQYEQNRLTLLRLLAVLNTEHLLEQNGLFDADTATLTQKSNELISHLLCNAKIDWTDSEYLEKYFALIKRIGIIHGVELEEIFVDLINRSIPGTNEQYEAGIVRVSADPDSTIDFMGSTGVQLLATGTNEDSEFTVPILYNDPQITRIVMLLKQIQNPMEKITEMLHRYNLDTAILPGGYMTKIRIATCILRFLTNVQMQEFGMNSNQFGVQLVSLLNQRLYSICRIEISANELQDSDKKLDFVRSILSPQSIYRQTPEMAHFLVCLIIDNDIKELNLLGKVAQRLLQLRLPWLLFEFLKYVRAIRDKDIKSIGNLPTYYCRTFEALFNTIDCSNDRAEVQRLIYFLISCPVEGGNQFAHAQSQLSAVHAQIAAALVSIAANAVADTSEYVQKNDGTVNYDVKLGSAKMT